MLMLNMEKGGAILVGETMIFYAGNSGNEIKIGMDAPKSVAIYREKMFTPENAERAELLRQSNKKGMIYGKWKVVRMGRVFGDILKLMEDPEFTPVLPAMREILEHLKQHQQKQDYNEVINS